MAEPLCHCGRPLHYSDPEARAMVEWMIDFAGDEYVTVIRSSDGRRWRVQRHFLALHGLKMAEIEGLGFEEIV